MAEYWEFTFRVTACGDSLADAREAAEQEIAQDLELEILTADEERRLTKQEFFADLAYGDKR